MNSLKTLFGFTKTIDRKTYFSWGIFLMILKYAIDFASLYIAQRHFLTPLEFISPLLSERHKLYAPYGADMWPLVVTYVVSLTMMWIGLSMTVRRAIDAGKPWCAFLYFIPYVNLVLMLVLSLLPSVYMSLDEKNKKLEGAKQSGTKIIIAMCVMALAGTVAVATIVFGAKTYGSVLFAGTPFIVGAVLGYHLNYRGQISKRQTALAASGTFFICAGLIFIFALEGLVCILMAAPIVLLSGVLGALLGRHFATKYFYPSKLSFVAVIPALLLFSFLEKNISPTLMGEVKSSIIINANVKDVWKNVVVFPKLQAPTELMFKAGISYPIQARIEGTGVGAIRYCEFNSGAFVEPITVWDENKRLAFDVTFQPRPMTELSLWENVEAPHIDGFFKSKHGEFRLIKLAENKTLLEGSTWYSLDIFPSFYWRLYSEWIVHNIHLRVLNHIKVNAES